MIVDYSITNPKNFTIGDPKECNSKNQYGYRDGKPCVLIKINRVCFSFRDQWWDIEFFSSSVLHRRLEEPMPIEDTNPHAKVYRIFPFDVPAKFVSNFLISYQTIPLFQTESIRSRCTRRCYVLQWNRLKWYLWFYWYQSFSLHVNDFIYIILSLKYQFSGKDKRDDIYQSPFVWVQFTNLTPHVLISVECRIFGANIFYDKFAQRASVRFQLYLNKNS